MKIYLAGPDVFLPDPVKRGQQLKQICADYGVEGIFPLDSTFENKAQSVATSDATLHQLAEHIAHMNEEHIRHCDVVVANLTPFRGISADAGTIYEFGYARGLGKMVYGWSNSAEPYKAKYVNSQDSVLHSALENKGHDLYDAEGLQVEDFDLPDNLMIIAGILFSGGRIFSHTVPASKKWHDLAMFEKCLSYIARTLITDEATP